MVPAWSSTCRGLTAIVDPGTERASSSPLRSKIVPRWAGSSRLRVHSSAAWARSASPPVPCMRPILASTPPRTRTSTTSVQIRRARGRPAPKRLTSNGRVVLIVRRVRVRDRGSVGRDVRAEREVRPGLRLISRRSWWSSSRRNLRWARASPSDATPSSPYRLDAGEADAPLRSDVDRPARASR